MTNPSSRIDPESLAALALHWMRRAWAAESANPKPDHLDTADFDEPDTPGGFAVYFSGINMNEYSGYVSSESVFVDAFDFGLAVAAAVLSDPLNNPVPSILDYGKDVGAVYRHYREGFEASAA